MKVNLLFTTLTACLCLAFSFSNVGVSAEPLSTAEMLRQTLKNTSMIDLARFLADFLVQHPETFKQLEDALLGAIPIIEFDPPEHGLFLNLVLPWALDKLPLILESHEFLGLMEIFIHRVNEVDVRKFMKDVPSGSSAVKRDYMMKKVFSDMDKTAMLKEMLLVTSVRDIVPYHTTDLHLNEQCYNDTMAFLDRLLMGTDWALDMFDAVGKPTTGLRRGVLHFIGTYDQCVAVNSHMPTNSSLAGGYRTSQPTNFAGRYCRTTLPVPRSLAESIAGDHINNTYGIPLTLTVGLCLPSSCHKDDIPGLLHLGFLGSMLNLSFTDYSCVEDQDFANDKPALVIIGIIGGLVVLVVCASTVELLCLGNSAKDLSAKYSVSNDLTTYENAGYELEDKTKPQANGGVTVAAVMKQNGTSVEEGTPKQEDDDSDLVTTSDQQFNDERFLFRMVRSFSVFTNIRVLLTTKTKDDDIPCLYGVRFLSMLWVILGNTFIYCALSLSNVPVAVNLMDSFDIMGRFTFQAVFAATFATDSFFVISGCLVTYWYLTRLNVSGTTTSSKAWLKFYLGRLWKLTPPYMLVLATYSFLYMYLGNGPLWPDGMAVADKCKTDWWKHLLYINNFVDVDGVEADQQCMTWSWYLAVQMQFYLISPIIISFMAFSKTIGLVMTVVLGVAGIIAAGVKENTYGGDILSSKSDGGAYWNNVFTKPWCRVASYCVGMLLGYALHNFYQKRIHKVIVGLCWLLAACLGVFLVYITYTKFEVGTWSRAEMAAYEALGRPAWAICVAWVVYACSTNNAGPLADFLAWKGFVPLSRLTFMVFLIHPVLMTEAVYTKRALVHLDDFDMTYLFIGHVVVCYMAAFLISLVIDAPFRNMKNLVSRKQIGRQRL